MPQGIFESNMVTLILLCLAVFRIYLEVINFDFASLPISRNLGTRKGQDLHKMGFYFSLGYFILFAPTYLLGY